MLTVNHTRYKNNNQHINLVNQHQQVIVLNHQLALRIQVQHHRVVVVAQVLVVQAVPKAVVTWQLGQHLI